MLTGISAPLCPQALEAAGLDAQQVEESLTLAGALPTLTVHNVSCFVDGEEEIIEGDVTKCKATVLLSRVGAGAALCCTTCTAQC